MIVGFYFHNYTRFQEKAADTTSQITLYQNKLVLKTPTIHLISYQFNIFKSYYSYTMPTKLFFAIFYFHNKSYTVVLLNLVDCFHFCAFKRHFPFTNVQNSNDSGSILFNIFSDDILRIK